jgi:hypothetical protein
MSNKVVSLYVSDDDIRNGYFVLADVLTKLPKDISVVDTRSSYSSAHTIFRLHSKEFPEIAVGHIAPAAYFKYNVNSGIEIAWPTKEYEDIMLQQHNKTIEETVNKDAEVMENEGGFPRTNSTTIQKALKEAVDEMITKTPNSILTGCQHEWFMYGRSAAFRHCKKCSMIKENIVDNS